MKRVCALFILFTIIISLTACNDIFISKDKYDEVSSYVLNNISSLSPNEDVEFFDYNSTGLAIGGVNYGYYYTKNNEKLLPDFYNGNDIDKIKTDKYEADDGVYFGKPNNGTDWCYIKEITNNWYYYELHWS